MASTKALGQEESWCSAAAAAAAAASRLNGWSSVRSRLLRCGGWKRKGRLQGGFGFALREAVRTMEGWVLTQGLTGALCCLLWGGQAEGENR